MKVLIIGGSGMIGHMLIKELLNKYEIFSIFRNRSDQDLNQFFEKTLIPKDQCIIIDDIKEYKNLEYTVEKISPDVIVNCMGIVKQRDKAYDTLDMIHINLLFPHLLNKICDKNKIRLIHFSTDCVFSGTKGNYQESDNPDPIDEYGESKLLGEIRGENTLTIRSSFVGPELFNKKSLFEWVKQNKNKTITGYTNAIYSGFTTVAFSKLLDEIIKNHPDMNGLIHMSSDPISKFDLIHLLNKKFKFNINIIPDSTFICDRSLNSMAFRKKTNISIPSWTKMINELYYYNM